MNVSNIQTIGVQAGAGLNDEVKVNNLQSTDEQVYVQCGSGSDVVDASANQTNETLLAGSGNDVIRVNASSLALGTNLATGLPNTYIQGSATGDTELDIEDATNVIVSNSTGTPTLQIGSYSEPLSTFATFQKMVVIGGPGTDTFTMNGLIPNVVLQGGSGSSTTNNFTISVPGTYNVVGGAGATNNLTVLCDNNGDNVILAQPGGTVARRSR